MNETLLDLNVIKEKFGKHLRYKYVLNYWFAQVAFTPPLFIGSVWMNTLIGKLSGACVRKGFFREWQRVNRLKSNDILGHLEIYQHMIDVRSA